MIALEHRICFEILDEIEHFKKSRRFILETEYGPKTMCCPKKLISVYRYMQDSKKRWEVWMPEWLAEKAGLI